MEVTLKTLLKYLFIINLGSISLNCFSQKITASFINQSLTSTLNTLSSRYNLKIAFDTQLADKTVISKSVKHATIDETLLAVIEDTELDMRKMGDVYMIVKKPKVTEESKSVLKTVEKSLFVSGIIKDKLTCESLPYATIYVSKNHLGIPANIEGFFRYETNSADTVYFVVSYIGYQPLAYKVLPKSNPEIQTILLEPQVQKFEEVVVKNKVEVFDNSGLNSERVKFSPSRLGNIPSIVELDISTPLQMLPGINATNENSGGLSLRKSAPDKTLIVYDGFTVYHMNHFFGAFSSVNTKSVKDIQIYKSGFAPRFGGSASGIIEITGKTGNMQKARIDVGIDMLSADAKIEIPIIKNKCSFIFAGRRSYTDKIQTPLFTNMFENVRYDFNSYYRVPPVAFSSNSKNPGYFYNDAFSKFAVKISENSSLSISAFSSYDKLHFKQFEEFPKMMENANWGAKGASIRYSGTFFEKWNPELIIGLSRTQFSYYFIDSIQRTRKRLILPGYITFYVVKTNEIESWLNNGIVTWNNTINLANGRQIETGLTFQNFNSLYDYNSFTYANNVSVKDTSKNYNNKARLNSLWFQYQLSGENWNLKPGIRFNRYSLIKKNYTELRLSGMYKLNSNILFRINAGNYYQFVNKINLAKRGDYRSTWVISSDKKIPVVASNSVAIGININITSTLNLDIEGYYKNLYNQITSFQQYRFTTTNNARIIEAVWLYDSKIKGVDFLAKQTFGPYQIWLSYTLSKSSSISKNNDYSVEYPSDDDQLHEMKILNLLKIKNWMLSLSGIYGSGIVWDEYIITDNLRLSPSYRKNNARIPEYFRVDAGINYSIKIVGTELKIGSNFYNLFDRQNVIQKFDKLSETPLQDINQNINPLEETTLYGLGFSYNFFLNLAF